MSLTLFTAIMVSVNVLIQCVALWQRHQSASEARRRRIKRNQKRLLRERAEQEKWERERNAGQ